MFINYSPRIVREIKLSANVWQTVKPESLEPNVVRTTLVKGMGRVAFTHAPKSGELAPSVIKALKAADYVVCCYGNAVRNRYRGELPRVEFVDTYGSTLPIYSSTKQAVLLLDEHDLIAAEEYEQEFNSFMAMG